MHTVAHCSLKLETCGLGDGFFGILNGVLFRVYADNVWTYDKFLEPTKIWHDDKIKYMTKRNMMVHFRIDEKLSTIEYANNLIDSWTTRVVSQIFKKIPDLDKYPRNAYVYVSADYICMDKNNISGDRSIFVKKNDSKFVIVNRVNGKNKTFSVPNDCFYGTHIQTAIFRGQLDSTIDSRYTKVAVTKNIVRDIDHIMFPQKRVWSWPHDLSVKCVYESNLNETS